ncbi:hypothetical protein [Hymenobacter properus]|uniref:Uncharacterized protein n=1 Tax=Hymenobacter properus TaxID=2791026 RepID=A0A931BJH1_9BACT|nr:hypothetical protein [Hymenobacter properus]MBF9142477.1 hypothetical protein [Hymenobacter properus]MBR7721284.1 hypothetical protein [Microvirga sp. SRT04]
MADINIQRKKASPSPWLLVLLAAVVLGLVAYFFLRPDPADEPTPSVAVPEAAAPVTTPDTLAAAAAVDQATRRAAIDAIPQGDTAGSQETAESLANQAASDPAAPDYARNGLQKLTGVLVALADRDDLRDATITEQRDNLTSATDRVGEPGASLRPGFVAAANLMRAMQQKAYPNLESQANELTRLASQLSGRSATAADQQQNKQFLTKAAEAVRELSEPASNSLN